MIRKRCVWLGLMSAVMLLAMWASPALAEDMSAYFEYGIDTETNTIIIGSFGMDSVEGDLVIPETIDGLPVTAIGPGAFAERGGILSITLPETLTTIHDNAFMSCVELTTINFPSSLTTIGDNAFADCYSLESLMLPDNVTSIGTNVASDDCTRLFCSAGTTTEKTIQHSGYAYATAEKPDFDLIYTLDSKTGEVTDVALAYFRGVPDENGFVVVPDDVTSVLETVLYYYEQSGILVLPDNITYVSPALMDYTILFMCNRGTVTEQTLQQAGGMYAYSDAPDYTLQAVLDSKTGEVTGIRLAGWPRQAEHVLPEGITLIEKEFYKDTTLTSITLPQSLTSIGAHAFTGCTNLATLTLPDNVTSLASTICTASYTKIICNGDTATEEALLDAAYQYSRADYPDFTLTGMWDGAAERNIVLLSGYLGDDTEIVIPDFIEGIGGRVFHQNKTITSVTLPAGLRYIGNYAFVNCSSLSSLTLPDNVTTIVPSIATSSYTMLYCSAGSVTENTLQIKQQVYATIQNPDFVLQSTYNSTTGQVTAVTLTKYLGSDAEIIIPEGVTAVNGFQSNKTITSVKLASTVKSISSRAFSSCTNLSTVVFNEGLTTIDSSAFDNCDALASVDLPQSLTYLGSSAFGNCNALTTLTLPDNLTTVKVWVVSHQHSGGYTRLYCNPGTTTESTLRLAGEYYSTTDQPNFLYRYTTDAATSEAVVTLVKYYGSDAQVTVADGVTHIGSSAFAFRSTLTGVTLPDSIREIGYSAFSNCKKLTSINFPKNLKLIGGYAFSACEGLSEIVLPEGLTTVNDHAFNDCINITSITLPSALATINYQAFGNCDKLMTLMLPDNVTTVQPSIVTPSYTKLYCNPGTVTENTLRLKGEYFVTTDNPDYSYRYVYDNNGVLTSLTLYKYYGTAAEVTVMDGVTRIGSSAFYNKDALTTITLPDSVTEIGSSAFSSCDSLTTVNLPAGLVKMESGTFSYCTALQELRLPDGVTSFGGISTSNYRPLVIANPGTTTAETLHAGKMTHATSDAPEFVKQYSVDSTTEKEILTLIKYFGNAEAPTIPQGYNVIGSSAFNNCDTLVSITIPESVTTIGSSAFNNCDALVSVTIPESVTIIGSSAFNNCKSLAALYLPNGVTSCNSNIINHNYTALVVERGSTTEDTVRALNMAYATTETPDFVCSYTTDSATGKEKVTLTRYWGAGGAVTVPEGVTHIGARAFEVNSDIVSVALPEGVTEIGSYAFAGCPALESLILPESLTTVGTYSFAECEKLAKVHLPDHLTKIYYYSYSLDFTTILCNPGTTTQETLHQNSCYYAFESAPDFLLYYSTVDGQGMLSVTKYLGDDTDVVVPQGVNRLNNSVFSQKGVTLTSISLPETLIRLESSCIGTHAGLASVMLPDNVAYIGGSIAGSSTRVLCRAGTATEKTLQVRGLRYATTAHPDFILTGASDGTVTLVEYTGSDTELNVPEGITNIEYRLFEGNTTLIKVTLPSTLLSIENYAFSNCDSLTEVVLPSSLKTILYGAFAECDHLAYLNLPDEVTSIANTIVNVYYTTVLCNPGTTTEATLRASGARYAVADKPEFTLQGGTDDSGAQKLTLVKYAGTDSDVVVYEGITGLGYGVFASDNLQVELTSITLPSTLRAIGNYAFGGQQTVATVQLPDGITSCDSYVGEITMLVNPDTITEKTLQAASAAYAYPNAPDFRLKGLANDSGEIIITLYRYTGSDRRVVVPDGVQSIGEYAFNQSDDERMTTLVLPDSVTRLENNALWGCSHLSTIEWPSNLQYIGDSALAACHALRTICLPSTVTYIGRYAFQYTETTSLTIPEGVTSLPHPVTEEAWQLTTLVLPRSLTEIAEDAFEEHVMLVYCYQGTAADTWATETGRYVIYLDDINLEDMMTITGPDWAPSDFEVGTAHSWKENIDVSPVPHGMDVTLACVSSDERIAKVVGDEIQLLSAGEVTLTISVVEKPELQHRWTFTVMEPVTSFTMPANVYVKQGETVTIYPQDIQPANANPEFQAEDTNHDMGYGFPAEYGLYLEELEQGVHLFKVYAISGVSRSMRVVVYEKVAGIAVTAPSRALEVGDVYQPAIRVTLDALPIPNEPLLYTLASSNEAVAIPTADGKLQAVGAGSAAITVTAVDGITSTTFTVQVENLNAGTLILPASLTVIGEEAFAGMPMEKVVIGSRCTTIGAKAFAGCASLTTVEIPASVTFIADNAFEGCGEITIIAPEGSSGHTFAVEHGIAWAAP